MSDLLRNSLQYADAEQQALAQQRELEEAQNAWAPIKGFRATRIGMDVNANNMDLAAARAGGRTDQAAQLAAENAQLQQRQGMHAPGIERVEDIGTKNGYLRDGLEWFGTNVGSGAASRAEPMAMAAGGALLSRVPAVTGRGDLQDTADRLDPETVTMLIDKCPQDLVRRSSSAWAKYALARRRISLALRSSRFSRSRAFMRSRSSLV